MLSTHSALPLCNMYGSLPCYLNVALQSPSEGGMDAKLHVMRVFFFQLAVTHSNSLAIFCCFD